MMVFVVHFFLVSVAITFAILTGLAAEKNYYGFASEQEVRDGRIYCAIAFCFGLIDIIWF